MIIPWSKIESVWYWIPHHTTHQIFPNQREKLPTFSCPLILSNVLVIPKVEEKIDNDSKIYTFVWKDTFMIKSYNKIYYNIY